MYPALGSLLSSHLKLLYIGLNPDLPCGLTTTTAEMDLAYVPRGIIFTHANSGFSKVKNVVGSVVGTYLHDTL